MPCGEIDRPTGAVGDNERDRQPGVGHGVEDRPRTRDQYREAHSGDRTSEGLRDDPGMGNVTQSVATISTMSSPASVGFSPTLTPASLRASILASAVPLPPETMAPAWPIFLPGGAVTPAT